MAQFSLYAKIASVIFGVADLQTVLPIAKEYEPFLTRRSIGYRLKKLSAILSREINLELEPFDLTRNHWTILGCLWQQNGVSVSEISQQAQQIGGTITGVLDRMEKRKLLKRKRDRKDKRIWRVHLSDEGVALLDVLPPVVKRLWDRGLTGFTEEERVRFSNLIDLGIRNLCPDYFAHLPERQFNLPYQSYLPPNSLGYRIKLLALAMGRIFTDKIAENNVTVSHWIVLCRLWQSDGVSVSEVGGYIEQIGGTVSGVLERMEDRGLIERKQNPNDKRCWKVFLSNAGAELANVLPPKAKAVLDQMLFQMSADDLEFFSSSIDRLIANFSD